MIAVRIFISNPSHLVNDLSLRRARSQRNLAWDFRLIWRVVNILIRCCKVLASQKQHLFVEIADYRDFGWRTFNWFIHEFFLL